MLFVCPQVEEHVAITSCFAISIISVFILFPATTKRDGICSFVGISESGFFFSTAITIAKSPVHTPLTTFLPQATLVTLGSC